MSKTIVGSSLRGQTAATEVVAETSLNRRQFLGGTALTAGAATMVSGCWRKPVERILPYSRRPEDLIPGNPEHYATSTALGGAVVGLLVESQDGRPTKVDGNPRHPGSSGRANTWAQASVWSLYDDDRAKAPTADGTPATWDQADAMLEGLAKRVAASKGQGLALLVESTPSPTFHAQLARVLAACPEAKVYRHDPCSAQTARDGLALAGAGGHTAAYHLNAASTILVLDSDLLGTEGRTVAHARDFAAGRAVDAGGKMSRLYAAEPSFTITGAMADHRLRLRGAEVGPFLIALAAALRARGVQLPGGLSLPGMQVPQGSTPGRSQQFLAAVADELAQAKGAGLVAVGARQPAWVHALAQAVNGALGAVGKTVTYHADVDATGSLGIADLTAAIVAGQVNQLVVLGGNPAFSAPGDLGFGTLMQTVPMSLVLSQAADETGSVATWHLPEAHYLEAWGDWTDAAGVTSLQQPLIAPIHGRAMSGIELLARLAGDTSSGHELVQGHWRSASASVSKGATDRLAKADAAQARAEAQVRALEETAAELAAAKAKAAAAPAPAAEGAEPAEVPAPAPAPAGPDPALRLAAAREALTKARAERASAATAVDAEKASAGGRFNRTWRRWLHDGVAGDASPAVTPSFKWAGVTAALAEAAKAPAPTGYELAFVVDGCVADGRYANNPWLQELPESMSKQTWGNAAYVSSTTAAALEVATGQTIQVTFDGRSLRIPVIELIGVANEVIVLPLGGGRRTGTRVAAGVGVDVNAVRHSGAPWIATGATVAAVPSGRPGSAPLEASVSRTQTADRLVVHSWFPDRRTLARQDTLDAYNAKPDFVTDDEHLLVKQGKIHSLWEEPNEREGQQWGMSIDLNACTGCNACAIACQAENNIPVVGSEEVANGRELAWIRLDRYYDGDDDDPQGLVQPLTCQQCENAPCEQVCPVAATTHSPEGLNDMAYNRCIGTRYCANNCPFKVRRFNFYNYTRQNDEELGLLQSLQRNPDVTVRFRGVMEKCTYCVQRINQAKVEAKRGGSSKVADGAIVPACQQTCPTGAIVFGDISDGESAVTKAKAGPRSFVALAELNIHPRTSFLARIRNPNPALKSGGA